MTLSSRPSARGRSATVPLLRRLPLITYAGRGPVAVRTWVRGSELGIVALAVAAGGLSGLLTAAMSGAVTWLHIAFFGPEAAHGPNFLRDPNPVLLLLVPTVGGLLLAGLNFGLARWRPRPPVDPIEANALYGGRMSLTDGTVVAAQNIISSGFGASVGLEAGYAQAGSSAASRIGAAFSLRRADMRLLVGCGAAGAIAAAFGAPLTGAFYAFELIIGTYAIAGLAPVIASAVVGVLAASALLGGVPPLAYSGGIPRPDWGDYSLAVMLGAFCGFSGIVLMRGMTIAEAALQRGVPWAILRPAVGGLLVGAMAIVTPGVLSSGHGALQRILSTEVAAQALLVLLVLKTLATAVSVGSGFRGGLFFASLLFGALIGKLFVQVPLALAALEADAMLFAIVGMSAFGAAVIGAPLAVTFLALETTRDFAVAGPVLAAVTVSALIVRRLFGYSFATWRFHLRGETIRSAHDVGWVRELTVGKLMRRDVRTVPTDMRLSSFRREFPLGSAQRVIAVDEADRYAGLVPVPEAHLESPGLERVCDLLRLPDRALLPAMNVKEAMAAFEAAEAEVMAVVDGPETRRVIGLLTEAHLLKRYGEELDKRRKEEAGLT
ncbi:MAG TPA: chloride channel protein [Microvirga sp.]|nr:chloride channel protein [Microvirga sp.]